MADPLVQTLPSTTRALETKYQNPGDLFPAGVDPTSPIAQAMVQLDVKRAVAGQNPYSKKQTQLGLLAAQTHQAQTVVPDDRGFIGNALNDIRTITGSIPRLPMALYHEAQALPTAPTAIANALGHNTGPLDMVAQLAQSPGVRMIPGSYLASNIQHPGELLKHPVFTALDALPLATHVPGVSTLTSKAGEAVKSAVSESAAWKGIRSSRPGMMVQETFAPLSRDAAQLTAEHNGRITSQAYGKTPIPEGDVLTEFNRQTNMLRESHPTITTDRASELGEMVQTDADAISKLSGPELAYVNDHRRIVDGLGDYTVSQGLTARIDGEIYTLGDAAKILRARKAKLAAADLGELHSAINPQTPNMTPDDIFTRMESTLARDDIIMGGKQGKLFRVEGYAHALQAAGYDAADILAGVRRIREMKGAAKVGQHDALDALISDSKRLTQPADVIPMADIIEELGKHPADAQAILTLDALKNGDWKKARLHAKNISRRAKFPIPDIESAIDQASTLHADARYLDKLSGYDAKGVGRITRAADKAEASRPPARFIPKLQSEVQAKVGARITENAVTLDHTPDWPTVLANLNDRNYGFLKAEGLIDAKEFGEITREVTQTWQELKASGYDPVFVHSVSPDSVYALRNPKVLEHVLTPTQSRRRMMDMTPAVKDMTAALSHQGMELLIRRGSEAYVQEFAQAFGKSKQEVLETYLPAARRAAERRPHLDVLGHAQQMMAKEFDKFDPEGMFGLTSPKLKMMAGNDDIYIPKTLANNIRRVRTPYSSRLTTAIDPIMGVYRTALLPLSPRWHVNNIISGGLLVTAMGGFDAWTHVREAWQMAKAEELPAGMPRGFGNVPRDTLEWAKSASLEEKVTALADHAAGKTLRRILDSTQTVRDKFGRVVEKSYEINGLFDDMYRSMAYLTGKDKALTKGMSNAAQHSAGIELARKTMMSWDRMTPIERTVMRYAFPFYGWMSHITKVAMTYPFDHPFRTAIVGSFARNELADMGTSLPQRFLNGFFFGSGPNKKFVNAGGMNPFSDVANYFTLSGLLGQANPIVGSFLETLGVDPMSGGPELYPTLRYDSDTGRLAASGTNPFEIFATNLLPQSQILMGLTGTSSQFKDMMRSNPEGAARQLLSSAGIPLTFKSVNVPQEDIKAESARIDAQTKVLSEALKTGDYSEAMRYPELATMLAKLKPIDEAGGLDKYKPQEQGLTKGQSAIAVAQKTLRNALVP